MLEKKSHNVNGFAFFFAFGRKQIKAKQRMHHRQVENDDESLFHSKNTVECEGMNNALIVDIVVSQLTGLLIVHIVASSPTTRPADNVVHGENITSHFSYYILL